MTPGHAEFVTTSVGVPVGVHKAPTYTEVDLALPRGATLLLYTDGAFERRGERIDVGLERLASVSVGATGSLEEFLNAVADGTIAESADDDTALLGMRWSN